MVKFTGGTEFRAEAPGLAEYLTAIVPELVPIEAACPYAAEVQLAIQPTADRGGVLHLMTHVGAAGSSGAGGRAGDQAPARRDHADRAIEALRRAADWAVAHGAMLRLIIKPMGLSLAEGPPVMHLFTERASAVLHLVGGPCRLHLLAPIAGRSDAWGAAELT